MDEKIIRGEPWMCGNGHLLGVMRQLDMHDEQGRPWRLYVLYKLRNARVGDCSMAAVEVPTEAMDSRIEGTVHDIACNVPGCRERKTWWQGKQAMRRLLAKLEVADDE